MQNNIRATIFYSLLFAMGGAPTIAMVIIRAQTNNPEIIYHALVGLSVIIACVLVPLMLIQNAFLFAKRHQPELEQRIVPLKNLYLGLNGCCLIFWIAIQYLS